MFNISDMVKDLKYGEDTDYEGPSNKKPKEDCFIPGVVPRHTTKRSNENIRQKLRQIVQRNLLKKENQQKQAAQGHLAIGEDMFVTSPQCVSDSPPEPVRSPMEERLGRPYQADHPCQADHADNADHADSSINAYYDRYKMIRYGLDDSDTDTTALKDEFRDPTLSPGDDFKAWALYEALNKTGGAEEWLNNDTFGDCCQVADPVSLHGYKGPSLHDHAGQSLHGYTDFWAKLSPMEIESTGIESAGIESTGIESAGEVPSDIVEWYCERKETEEGMEGGFLFQAGVDDEIDAILDPNYSLTDVLALPVAREQGISSKGFSKRPYPTESGGFVYENLKPATTQPFTAFLNDFGNYGQSTAVHPVHPVHPTPQTQLNVNDTPPMAVSTGPVSPPVATSPLSRPVTTSPGPTNINVYCRYLGNIYRYTVRPLCPVKAISDRLKVEARIDGEFFLADRSGGWVNPDTLLDNKETEVTYCVNLVPTVQKKRRQPPRR